VTVPFITRAPIRPDDLLALVQSPERGGTAMFLGTVRHGPEDGPVVRIEYTGYEPMVESEFGRIVAEAEARWPACRVAAVHRLGDVPLGEASIAVAAAAPHRTAALEACRYAIEEAKQRLPVWKREVRADGTASWRDNAGGRVAGSPPPR
jgi:molybdopterin synthase catalytic subunit